METSKRKIISGTVIKRCDCTHKYQDSIYGKQMRVKNLNTSGDSKCTVCGKMEK